MGYGGWKPYVPVAKRRGQAQKAAAKAKKAGQDYQPVSVSGRAIAKTFWGKAWCDNLQAYSDFENRLPRGRTYVRNGSVIDLKIEPGKILGLVMGSSLYRVEIGVAALPAQQWQAIVQASAGSIASLVELLQGKFSKAVMERLCQPKTGLFPSPKEIQLACSCPDWATMCKHVAAVLYGVGARLDEKPELLFTLRQVDAGDLVSEVAELSVQPKKTPAKGRMLDDAALADVFGIELGEVPVAPPTPPKKPRASARKAVAPKPKATANTPTRTSTRTTKSSSGAQKTSAQKTAKSGKTAKQQATIDATRAETPRAAAAKKKVSSKQRA